MRTLDDNLEVIDEPRDSINWYPLRPMDGGPLPAAPPKIGRWAYEPKWDGRRILMHRSGFMFNRRGERMAPRNEAAYEAAMRELKKTYFDRLYCSWLDCEGLGRVHPEMYAGCVVALDLATAWSTSPGATYMERRSMLVKVADAFGWETITPDTDPAVRDKVFILPVFGEPEARKAWPVGQARQPRTKLGRLHKRDHPLIEGFVAKRIDSLYEPMKKPDHKVACWVKHRHHAR